MTTTQSDIPLSSGLATRVVCERNCGNPEKSWPQRANRKRTRSQARIGKQADDPG